MPLGTHELPQAQVKPSPRLAPAYPREQNGKVPLVGKPKLAPESQGLIRLPCGMANIIIYYILFYIILLLIIFQAFYV